MNTTKGRGRLLSLIGLAVFGTWCNGNILAIDPTTTVTFELSDFTEISVSSVFNVTVTQGPDFLVEVTIDEDVVDRADVTQTGTRLNIALLPGNDNIDTIEAFVTLPVLDSIDLDGVVSVSLNDFNQTQLSINVAGVSQLRGDSLMIGDLTASVSGVSRLDLVDISPLGSADIDVGGVSEATLHMDVASTLTGSLTGTSKLSYYGSNVVVNVMIDPGLSVVKLGETLTGDFRINAGLNGSWFNPDTTGQGFFVEVLPEIPLLFLSWFTYDTTQSSSGDNAVVGDINHRWLTAQGEFAGDNATLDVTLTTGGLFDDPAAPASNSPPGSYGTITISFEDCSNGQVVYNLTSSGLSGTIPIKRLANTNVPLCEQLVVNGTIPGNR